MGVSGQLHAPAALDRRLAGSQSWSGRCGEEKNFALPGIELGPACLWPVSILTELSRLLLCVGVLERFSVE
jgi:hypothetical protein